MHNKNKIQGWYIYGEYNYSTDKALFNVTGIAWQASKNTMGCSFHKGNAHKFYIYGRWADAVRVYSALKNNGYVFKIKRFDE